MLKIAGAEENVLFVDTHTHKYLFKLLLYGNFLQQNFLSLKKYLFFFHLNWQLNQLKCDQFKSFHESLVNKRGWNICALIKVVSVRLDNLQKRFIFIELLQIWQHPKCY